MESAANATTSQEPFIQPHAITPVSVPSTHSRSSRVGSLSSTNRSSSTGAVPTSVTNTPPSHTPNQNPPPCINPSPSTGAVPTPVTNTPTSHTPNQNLPTGINQPQSVPANESLADRWWLLEGFALLVSIASLMSITAVLIKFDENPLSTWNLRISLNALVAILAAVSRSSLIFPLSNSLGQWKWMKLRKTDQPLISLQHYEEACRSPWGCAKLLCRPRYFSFASFGAFAIAMALTFEPFAQQAVSFPTRNTTVGHAFLPRATYYGVPYDDSSRYLAAMKVALYNNLVGLGTPAAASRISATCPTGNCEWGEYTSIAVCSQCIDISSRISYTVQNSTNIPPGCPFDRATEDCTFQIATPNEGVPLMWQDDNPLPVMNSTTFGQSTNLLNGNTYTSLLNLSMIAMPTVTDFVAYDCIFYGCGKKYSATVANGVLTERVTKTYWNTTLPTGLYIPGDHHILGAVANLSTTIPASDLESGVQEVLNFDYEDLWWIFENLKSSFGGYSEVIGGLGDDNHTFEINILGGFDIVSDQSVALWENGVKNFPQSMEQLAEGLTNYMRMTTSSEQAVGIAIGGQSYIHVQWAWLIPAYALELIAYLFVLGTVIAAKRCDVPFWKTESLVLWYHTTRSTSMLTQTIKSMDELAGSTKIQLLGPTNELKLLETVAPTVAAAGIVDISKGKRIRKAAAELAGAVIG